MWRNDVAYVHDPTTMLTLFTTRLVYMVTPVVKIAA